ncbi:unnamed protein product, partial [Meganyctiphanes norvegica]
MAVSADRLRYRIYQDIQGDMACFKRFNGTHEIGCSSKFWGNVGVIHLVEEDADLDWVIESGKHAPYTIAIYDSMFTLDVLNKAQVSKKVNGVVVFISEDHVPTVDHFSGESTCPNAEISLYKDDPNLAGYCEKKPWNPQGSSLMYMSWDFPIFLIDNQDSIGNITECYKRFNNATENEYPLCALELSANMFGTTNTEVCIRRANIFSFSPINFCDPLSDMSIWGSLLPMNKTKEIPDKSVIVVATKMDSTSMFDNISPGGNAAITGLVTLMATAEALFRYKAEIESSDSDKNVVFFIFQGESWGYIGSSRVVWEMSNNKFPFKYDPSLSNDTLANFTLDHIDHFIELSQLGLSKDNTYFMHTDPIARSDPDIDHDTDTLMKALIMKGNASGINFTSVDKSIPLPPSSFQSFLKNKNISGVVITDHNEEYENQYYGSVFDNYHNVQYKSDENGTLESDELHIKIKNIAESLANTLFLMSSGKAPEDSKIEANATLVNDLLYCYLENVNCTMFRDYGQYPEASKSSWQKRPVKTYVSVGRNENQRTFITRNVFTSLFGEEVNLTESDCKSSSYKNVFIHNYYKTINNGTCIQSTIRPTLAISPAFEIEGYNWTSGEYSTWTESGWEMMKVRMFIIPPASEEIGLVCGGAVSVILSFLLVYFFNARADLLFGLGTQPAAC